MLTLPAAPVTRSDPTVAAPGIGPPVGRWRRSGPIPVVIPAVVAGVVFLAAKDNLADDALISLSYARTIALHGTWGMQPGIPANAQTSPLNALLLAGLTTVVRSVIVAAGLAWIAAATSVALSVTAIARRLGASPACGPVAGVVVATSPVMVATIGLETGLVVALLAALAWAVLARGPVAVGVLAGSLILTRPDTLGFAALALALCGRSWWRGALVGAAVAAPWFAWSWWFLGSAVPDTLLFKMGSVWTVVVGADPHPITYSFTTGPLLYAVEHPAGAMLIAATLGVATVGVVVLARDAGPGRRVVVLLVGGAVGYHATLLALSPGPYAWYYGPQLQAVVIAGCLGLALLRGFGPVAAVGCALLVVAVLARPWPITPETGNWATAAQYAAAAGALPPGPVVVGAEIGAVTFYCDGRCLTVGNGFSERASAAPIIRKKITDAPAVVRWLLEINYARLDAVPPTRAPVELITSSWADEPEQLRRWPAQTRWTGQRWLVLVPTPDHPR